MEISIDTLRNGERYEDGFRLASRMIVKKGLELDHVTHLQRYDRTVAMRQETKVDGELYYRVDYARPEPEFVTSCLNTAVDFVIDYLNQGEHGYEAGDTLSIWCNQAARGATVLAVIDDEIMVEGEMPGTTAAYGRGRWRREAEPTTFLVKFNVRFGMRRGRKNYSYNAVPKKWLRAIDKQSGDWIGMGQRMREPLSLTEALAR